jgi:hypothetical protein
MKKLLALFIAATCAVSTSAFAAAYTTEATISLQKDEGTYKVYARVSKLVVTDGKVTEKLITQPRIQSSPGVPASLYVGPKPSESDYATKENVTTDVSWPFPNESGTASCSVTIRQGNEIVYKSNFQLKVAGPGRTPLIVAVADVVPKSVRVVEDDSTVYLLVELVGKTKAEVKKLAIENSGNKVKIRDSQGGFTDGGLSLGTNEEQTAMVLHFDSKNAAMQVAGILRGEKFH